MFEDDQMALDTGKNAISLDEPNEDMVINLLQFDVHQRMRYEDQT